MDCIPCVVFGFNRPRKLKRVLNALREQNIDRLIIFVDGPRYPKDERFVLACRAIAENVDWMETELHFWDTNHGLERLGENISLIFENYHAAVFLEDDCLPTRGFYEFIKKALIHYKDEKKVFSIGGYQPIGRGKFLGYPFSLVSCPRFICWGWGSWKDRWESIQTFVIHPELTFDGLKKVSKIAGNDLPQNARNYLKKGDYLSWDVKVALACLWTGKVNLLPSEGLIRNIGLDGSGIHGHRINWIQNFLYHNRNIIKTFKAIKWLENVNLNLDYSVNLIDFVNHVNAISICRYFNRLRILLIRIYRGTKGVLNDLQLLQNVPEKQKNLALLSYLTHPFYISEDDPRFLGHINMWHAIEIVRVLNQMGYIVDVIDYRDKQFVPSRFYDLFIGHGGQNFSKIAQSLPDTTPKIYFSTGSYWKYHNKQEKVRFEMLRERRKGNLPYDRLIWDSEDEPLKEADGIIGIGNTFTKETYQDFSSVIMINGTSLYDDFFERFPKDYENGRKHFLFFSSRGSVHKGLDLLLEAFEGLEQHLWICSPIERKFKQVYFQELNHRENIHNLGWTQPRSGKFYRVVWRCNYCILPSASEGQAQSVVECMNHGLVPIVSRTSGINVNNFGIYIENFSISYIRKIIRDVTTLPEDEIQTMSNEARRICQSEYSEEAFIRNMSNAIKTIIK